MGSPTRAELADVVRRRHVSSPVRFCVYSDSEKFFTRPSARDIRSVRFARRGQLARWFVEEHGRPRQFEGDDLSPHPFDAKSVPTDHRRQELDHR